MPTSIMKQELLNKISRRDIKVGVVGLGYVGLPLAVEKAKAGFKTIGFDVQSHKVDMVNAGINYIGDVVDDDLKEIVSKGFLSATSDFNFVKDVNCCGIGTLLQAGYVSDCFEELQLQPFQSH